MVGTIDIHNLMNSVSVFPNPSAGKLYICNAEAGSLLTVTNTLGEIICKKKTSAVKEEIDLSREAKGLYFYQLSSPDNFTANGKIVLQ